MWGGEEFTAGIHGLKMEDPICVNLRHLWMGLRDCWS
jgi:hypothetical protein